MTDELAKVVSWRAPDFPGPKDPGPFDGSLALG